MDIDRAHKTILRTAAAIANHDPRKPPLFQGDTFFEANVLSEKGGLALAYDIAPNLRTPEITRVMGTIAREAVRQALVQHKDILVTLILDAAREGQNYFDRYTDDSIPAHG